MPTSYHFIFLLFWVAQIIYGFMCTLGPLISSGLTPPQSMIQDWLIRILLSGVIVTPLVYVSALCEPRWSYVKYVLLFPVGLIPGMSTVLRSFWVCLISPAFLAAAIAATVAFYRATPSD